MGGRDKRGGEERTALVAGVYAHKVVVLDGGRELILALTGRQMAQAKLVAGDKVRYLPQGEGGVIVGAEPRLSQLMRATVGRTRRSGPPEGHVIAANVELVVIVGAAGDPPFNRGLAERLLTAAAKEGMETLICLNKLDLDQEGLLEALRRDYGLLGIQVVGASAREGRGLSELAAHLAGKVSVLVGHSGVGKTSLLNGLTGLGHVVQPVGDGRGRGRHTTSASRLIALPGGGWLIDSPGVREWGLHGLAPLDLARHFPGLAQWAADCGFRDCRHRDEPGCLVRHAAESGGLDPARYRQYLKLLAELEAAAPSW